MRNSVLTDPDQPALYDRLARNHLSVPPHPCRGSPTPSQLGRVEFCRNSPEREKTLPMAFLGRTGLHSEADTAPDVKEPGSRLAENQNRTDRRVDCQLQMRLGISEV